jgi:hypothetical protein
LLQQAGMHQLGAVTVPGWQHRTPHADSSRSSGRRRRGLPSVPLSGIVDKSTMLATL